MTTTWSRRGTRAAADDPGEPPVDERFTRPAVNDASKTSVTSIEAVMKLLNHYGPSSTSWFGSTVATVLPAP